MTAPTPATLIATGRELAAAATPGEWRIVNGATIWSDTTPPILVLADTDMTRRDAALIAWLRNHAVELFDALEAANVALVSVRNILVSYRDARDAEEAERSGGWVHASFSPDTIDRIEKALAALDAADGKAQQPKESK